MNYCMSVQKSDRSFRLRQYGCIGETTVYLHYMHLYYMYKDQSYHSINRVDMTLHSKRAHLFEYIYIIYK